MDPNSPEVMQALAASAGMLLVGLAVFIVFATCLMVIARKTGTPNGWMAYIPLLNFYLMCRIGRKPGWWLLLLFIPLVNLVIGVIVWMGMAEARGKPGWYGLLILVPIANFIVPFLLAAGPPSAAPSSAPGAHPSAPPPPYQAAAPPPPPGGQPRKCQACGTVPDPDELFCGECGARIESPAQAAPPPPPGAYPGGAAAGAPSPAPVPVAASGSSGVVLAVVVIFGLLIAGAAAYFLLTGRAPAATKPQMAQALSGKLTEFPVDTNPVAPARPTQVTSKKFGSGSSDESLPLASKTLPPGVDEDTLQQTADSVVTATYKSPEWPTPVNVHVVEPKPGADPARTYAGRVASSVSGAQQSGVRVESPAGGDYRGYKVTGNQEQVFVLSRVGGNVLIIIYAPSPEVHELSERLASNVGNGDGLNDYPETQDTLWRLPANPPEGLSLEEVGSYNPNELVTEDDWSSAMSSMETQEGRELVQKARRFMPDSIITGRYQDPSRNRYDVILGRYGSARATFVWLALQFLFRLADFEKVDVQRGDAYQFADDDGQFLLIRNGGYLGLLRADPQAPMTTLLALATGMQI